LGGTTSKRLSGAEHYYRNGCSLLAHHTVEEVLSHQAMIINCMPSARVAIEMETSIHYKVDAASPILLIQLL
jgi:hypothetical protein